MKDPIKIAYVSIDCPMIKQEQDKNYEALQNAIKHFEDKIAKQGMITNARDEEHLTRLKIMFANITMYKLK